MNPRMLIAVFSLLLVAPSFAQSAWVERILDAYHRHMPIDTDPNLGQDEAVRIQDDVIAALRPDYGDVFGYKAGLTSAAAQKRFNLDQPVMGVLLDRMILDNGARISVGGGVHMLIEGDLLVRVKDRRINRARTAAEAFESIDRVAPFLEVPDVIIRPGQPLTGPVATAVNSGAWLGVMGEPVPTTGLEMENLAEFTMTLTRNDGEAKMESSGRDLMGDPLNVVLWLAGEARRRGIILEPGDWLSLGSLTPPVEARAGDRYRALYTGLGDRQLEIGATFVP